MVIVQLAPADIAKILVAGVIRKESPGGDARLIRTSDPVVRSDSEELVVHVRAIETRAGRKFISTNHGPDTESCSKEPLDKVVKRILAREEKRVITRERSERKVA
ncbi:hypothetical protein L0Y40_03255 [Candidatus Wolfebacteria bacterium]|nr:hypothetical protein [Candidatus Wolfebacteria bacterium]